VKRQRAREFVVEGVRPINQALTYGWSIVAYLYARERPLSGWATDILASSVAQTHFELPLPLLARLDTLSAQRYVSPYLFAGVAEALGDRRRAFAWLEEAVADPGGVAADPALDPRLDRPGGDPRVARLPRRVGRP